MSKTASQPDKASNATVATGEHQVRAVATLMEGQWTLFTRSCCSAPARWSFFFDRTGRASGGQAAGIPPRRRPFNITFARLFSLMTVGVLGVGLAFSDADAELATSGFTLPGTIAGYLAGAKPTTVTEPDQDGNGKPPVTIL